jgi:IS30 family transposase
MIVHIWDQVQLDWKLHNHHVHGKKASIEDADLRRRTIGKIYLLHRLRRKVLQDHVQHLFLTDVCTTVRTSTLKFLRTWIRIYEPSIHESICSAQSSAVQHTKSLTTFKKKMKYLYPCTRSLPDNQPGPPHT